MRKLLQQAGDQARRPLLWARLKSDRLYQWWYQWALRHLPAGLIVRPMEGFIGFLCLFVGLGILTSLSQPPSAEQFMSDGLYGLWGGALVFGGFALMCGVYSIRWVSAPLVFQIKQVECYRLGLRLLAMSTGLYAIALGATGGWNSIPAAAMTLYFTLSCASRLLTLGKE